MRMHAGDQSMYTINEDEIEDSNQWVDMDLI